LVFGNSAGPAGEIVGVVHDVIQGQPGSPILPQLYIPWAQLSTGDFHVVVRTAGDPATWLSLLKSEVHAIDKDQPIAMARTLEDLMSDTLARHQLMLSLLAT